MIEKAIGTTMSIEVKVARLDSRFGEILIVWEEDLSPILRRIYLPHEGKANYVLAKKEFSLEISKMKQTWLPSKLVCVEQIIADVLNGHAVQPPEALLRESLHTLNNFQRAILLTEATIPFGRVSTYGELAFAAGFPSGFRAAAHALAQNPFPLLIPCHRVIASNGGLAGYQGGIAMKKELLSLEHVPLLEHKVDMRKASRWLFNAH